jgi:hypothetical protein
MPHSVQKGQCLHRQRRGRGFNLDQRPELISHLAFRTVDWPMQRIEMRPFPAGPTFMIEVISFGALGAQLCQA